MKMFYSVSHTRSIKPHLTETHQIILKSTILCYSHKVSLHLSTLHLHNIPFIYPVINYEHGGNGKNFAFSINSLAVGNIIIEIKDKQNAPSNILESHSEVFIYQTFRRSEKIYKNIKKNTDKDKKIYKNISNKTDPLAHQTKRLKNISCCEIFSGTQASIQNKLNH